MHYFKCVKCQSLFPKKAIIAHASKYLKDVTSMDCPVCGCRFTNGKLGQEFHGQSNSPSIREVEMENPVTASPDDR